MAVVEVITFRLAGGADRNDALRADERVQTEFSYRQPGFVRRTTAISDDGEWLVLQLWQSLSNADAAADAARNDPIVKRFQGFVDPATTRHARYETLD
jgi:hypothetical protein